jgi:hypothetical protein
MRIHTDHNGVAVNAISRLADGAEVEGHQYQVLAGSATSEINFQLGPVGEHGVNGLTNEALLSILIHRTGFLNHKFPCRENSIAITNMEQALMWLEKRTSDRLDRNVEGKNLA